MGSVERVLVLGIVVVIVAILGIAVWGATGDDAGPLAVAATDGGVASADGPAHSAQHAPLKDAGPAAVKEIERWRKARQDLRDQNLQKPPLTPDTNVPLKSEGDTTPLTVKPQLGPGFDAQPDRPARPQVHPVRAPQNDPAPPPPPVKAKAARPDKHKVVEGDNLWKITFKYYGDSDIQEHLDAILAANPWLDPDGILQVGVEIALPNIAMVAATDAPAAAKTKAVAGGKLYEVKSGDTLSEIASRMLGSSKRWDEIYELNRDRVTAPDALQVGMTLRLPKS